jgi:hypothetical protein
MIARIVHTLARAIVAAAASYGTALWRKCPRRFVRPAKQPMRPSRAKARFSLNLSRAG